MLHYRKGPLPRYMLAHDVDPSKPTRDPTGTVDIRRRYKSALDMRWRKVRNAVRDAIVTNDLLNLTRKQTALSGGLAMLRGDELVQAYQTMIDATLKQTVLENDAEYLDAMVARSYRRAVSRGVRLANSKVLPEEMEEYIFTAQRLVVVELQGIVEAVSQRLVREASLAVLDANTPAQVFAASADAIEKVGVARSRALVEFHVVKAHAAGTLDAFEAAGMKNVRLVPETMRVEVVSNRGPAPDKGGPRKTNVGLPNRALDARRKGPGSRISREVAPSERTVRRIRAMEREVTRRFRATMVEVQTAGDDLVCPTCEDISADGPYTIDQARSLIPAHPNCRCTFVPEEDFEG